MTTPNLTPDQLPACRLWSYYQEGLQGCEIKQSEIEGKGLGVYATRDILPCTVILSESPLLVAVENGERPHSVKAAYNALTPEEQTAFRSLHAYRPESRAARHSLIRSILDTNAFGMGNDTNGVFLLASRINHSCIPNTRYAWNYPRTTQKVGEKGEMVEQKGRLVFVNDAKLLEGEEVTIDYGHKTNGLRHIYGFQCDCGGCTDSGVEYDSSDSESEDEDEDENEDEDGDATQATTNEVV